jgi:hypothetical protein
MQRMNIKKKVYCIQNNRKCSQGNVMNTSKNLYYVVVINQPKKIIRVIGRQDLGGVLHKKKILVRR